MDDGAELLEAGDGPAGAAAPLGAGRLLFRFTVGGSLLAEEWFVAALRTFDQPPQPGSEVVPPASGRTAVVGALSAALRWRPPGGRERPRAASGRRGATLGRAAWRGLRLFAHVPGVEDVGRRARGLRRRGLEQLRRWSEEGAREIAAGRRLAGTAVPGLFDLSVARLADSPEIQHVIEEQSQGLAEASVAELREASELADRTVERTIQRFGRRLGRRLGRRHSLGTR